MEAILLILARRMGLAAAALAFAIQAQAQTVFSDNFDDGASSLWQNEAGAWSATAGTYAATSPGNFPSAFSSLPFNLTNFSVEVIINGVVDGGIWLRSSAAPGTSVGIKGILLVVNHTGPENEGQIYWHIVGDGSAYGDSLNVKVGAFTVRSNPNLRVTVSGSSYSAFINGSTTAATSLTTSAFGSGRVALYDNSSQSFDNFALKVLGATGAVTVPSVVLPAVEVRWHSQLGRWYQVQWAPPGQWDRMVRPAWANAPWSNVGAPLPGTGAIMTYSDTQRRPPRGYYRVQLLP